MLERYAMKVARTVLRGGSGSNAAPLPDQPTTQRAADKWDSAGFTNIFLASNFSTPKQNPRLPQRQ